MEIRRLRPLPFRLVVADNSGIGAARRAASAFALEAGADETAAGRVAIVATELATNLALHAGGGSLLVQALDLGSEGRVIELLSLDRGAGMPNVDRCLADGYSTAGTAGNGLGAVRRLSQQFDLHSEPGKGSVVLSRIALSASAATPARPTPPQFGALCLPVKGETLCGDTWRLSIEREAVALMVADGLGHGPLAAAASEEAAGAFDQAPDAAPGEILQRAHERMQHTRGSAVACARFDRAAQKLRYAGIGNISGMLLGGHERRGLVSHNGTVGAQMRRVQEFDYPCPAASLLVMHSDGLSAKWNLMEHPGLMDRHPAVIAGLLYRDHHRERDDASVVVVALPGASS